MTLSFWRGRSWSSTASGTVRIYRGTQQYITEEQEWK